MEILGTLIDAVRFLVADHGRVSFPGEGEERRRNVQEDFPSLLDAARPLKRIRVMHCSSRYAANTRRGSFRRVREASQRGSRVS